MRYAVQRIAVAIALGLVAAALAWVTIRRPHYWPDLVLPWTGARLLLGRQNPYTALPGGLPEPFTAPLFYPLPALLTILPVAWLPLPLAGAAFAGLSIALLAFALARGGWWRLWMLASPSAVFAVSLGQWAPLVTLGALLAAATYDPSHASRAGRTSAGGRLVSGVISGWCYTLKPNLGAAAWLARPTWRAAAGVLVALAVSAAVLPGWLGAWRANLGGLDKGHTAPMLTLLGAPALLALLRWRRPEARLVATLACMPQLLMWADQLPLLVLVPRTRNEAIILNLCACLGFLVWLAGLHPGDLYVPKAAPYVLATTYLPCLVMVLRRPNEGGVPAWLDVAAGFASRSMKPIATRLRRLALPSF